MFSDGPDDPIMDMGGRIDFLEQRIAELETENKQFREIFTRITSIVSITKTNVEINLLPQTWKEINNLLAAAVEVDDV